MPKYLVIVESPAKEKTISKFLGKDFIVRSSYGHIRDLPKSKLGIDTEHDFTPTYINIKKSERILSDLRSKSAKTDKVYLATDLDREGEAIAWHLKEALELSDDQIERITFHEITPEAINDAVKHPRKLNMGLVNSQQARRILDRIVGYKLSPLLWSKIKKGLSAGRVQSVAVMIICDREQEIQNFVPVEYWNIEANLSKQNQQDAFFTAGLISRNGEKIEKLTIKNQQEADNILKGLEGAVYTVSNIESKNRKRAPYPPYTTSTLQQDASRRLGFSASKTMMIAQKLYEGINIGGDSSGLITYMRTDSLNIAKSCQMQTLDFIEKKYGKDFVPQNPRIYKTKSKGAQEAHEAIRPTSPNRLPEQIEQYLSADEFKLYFLIWKRFIASQMSEAVYNVVSVDIKANDCIFRATGSVLIFDGFMRVYNIEETEREMKIPKLDQNEILDLIKLSSEQKFTEPPPRFNEASLIKALEEYGIGRPSTYAPIINTILQRLYVKLENKRFTPTPLGIVVNDVLKKYFGNIVSTQFTAAVEEKLDHIAENQIEWQKVIGEFYHPFEHDLKNAQQNLGYQKVEAKQTDIICPKCGKPMLLRMSRGGEFLGCSGFPECKFTMSLDRDGNPVLSEQETTDVCEKCGQPLVRKIGFAKRPYLICKNPDCGAKYSIDSKGNKVFKPAPEMTDIKCQKCGSPMLKRKGKRGEFLTCQAFPKCRNLIWLTSEKKAAEKKAAKSTKAKTKTKTKKTAAKKAVKENAADAVQN
ncbi:MAG: type I DNA topoisomerase [Elusimicrobiota bacterium]|jgi:DNA topoisomerase-1|nr:type I DNA topoisomerase [Elusimicrobiota bacterium]